MPQRQNGDGGADPEPRVPAIESDSSHGEDFDRMLEEHYNQWLSRENSLLTNDNVSVETPEWLEHATNDTLSWQELHEEAERFRQEFSVPDGGDDGFVSKHPTKCPSISLPLQDGQIERDTITGEYFIYSNRDGDHTWAPITISNMVANE